jgi:hypothetical protein
MIEQGIVYVDNKKVEKNMLVSDSNFIKIFSDNKGRFEVKYYLNRNDS